MAKDQAVWRLMQNQPNFLGQAASERTGNRVA